MPARTSPNSKPTPLSGGGVVSPNHAYRPHHRTRLQPLPTVLMPDPGTLFFGGLCSSSALGPCWAPGLGEQSVCVTHSPGPPLATPLLLGSPAPCSPPGAPKPAAAGGVGERHGLPLLRAGRGGLAQGTAGDRAPCPQPGGRGSAARVALGEKCARGRRPGSHPPWRRGAAARPAPSPPGSPAFLAGACGFLPAPGARSGLAAERGAGLAGHERQEGVAAEGTVPGSRADGRARPAAASAAPPPTPTSATAARSLHHLHRPGCERLLRPGRWFPSHPRRKRVPRAGS